jgi:hypothetical protein
VADKGIVNDGELPPTWGLLVLNGRGLVQTVPAPSLTSTPIDRPFLAGLLRAAGKAVAKEDQKMLSAARQRGYEEGQKSNAKHDSHWRDEYEKLSTAVARFQEVSGVRINKYAGNDAEARRVKEVIESDRALVHSRRELSEMRRCVSRMDKAIREAESLDNLDTTPPAAVPSP